MTKTTKVRKPLKTNIHAIFQTNKLLEDEGAWVEVNGFYGLHIKVRRLKADSVGKAYERIVKEKFGEGKLRTPQDITADESMELLKAQMAEAVLVDWKNLRDTDTGEEIPFSIETALELMEISDFREFVYQAANERDTFRAKADAAALGNSPTS